MLKQLKIIVSLMVILMAFLPSFASASSLDGSLSTTLIENENSMIIRSIETGEAIGERFFENIIETTYDNNEMTKLVINTKITDVSWRDNSESVRYETDEYTFENEKLITMNGEKVDENAVARDLLNPNVSTFSSTGGVYHLLYYSQSSRGGYNLRATLIKGIWDGGLNALFLDPSGAQSETLIIRHAYLHESVYQGWKVSDFMLRADLVDSARQDALLIHGPTIAAAGITTIFNVWAGIGAGVPACIAAYNNYSAAKTDIEQGYNLLSGITNE